MPEPVMLRRIPAVPRKFYLSTELLCPDDLLSGFEELKKSVTAGDDLTQYQSKLILRADYSDMMLFDWGIPENGLYVEGSVLSDLLMGNLALQEVRSNRILLVTEPRDDKTITDMRHLR
jgi:hypothetical protein